MLHTHTFTHTHRHEKTHTHETHTLTRHSVWLETLQTAEGKFLHSVAAVLISLFRFDMEWGYCLTHTHTHTHTLHVKSLVGSGVPDAHHPRATSLNNCFCDGSFYNKIPVIQFKTPVFQRWRQ